MRDSYSRLAAKIQPHLHRGPTIQSVINVGEEGSTGGTATAPGVPDYTIMLDGANCVAYDNTGEVAFTGTDHGYVMQQAINGAAIGGVLAWRTGDYNINAPLQPMARQSWYLPYNAVFRPTGDNRIIEAVAIDWWHVYGTLHIEDTDQNSTSREAIYLDGIAACYFQDIKIWDYYKGVTLAGYTQRAFENVFQNLYMAVIRHQGLAIWAEVGDNYFANVFAKGPSTIEWATGQGLVIGLYPVNGTIFGGIMFGRVELLDFQVNMDLQGLYECWFDQILSDNAYWAAIFIGDAVQRLFIGTIWTAGSGDGLWVQGTPARGPRAIRINQIFSWINAQFGIHFNGWVEDVYIGSAYLLENQIAQLKFSRSNHTNIHINNLAVVDSNLAAIDAGGVDNPEANVNITHADIDDGECMGLDLLRHIDGVRNGEQFSNRGVTYITTGTSYTVVPHNLEGRPLYVSLTPHHYDARQAFVSTIDTANFIVDAGANVSTTARVAWEARSGVEVGNELLFNSNVE